LVRIAVKQALRILHCGKVIFAHKSNRRSGDVVIRCEVANPIFGHCLPPSFCGKAGAVPRQLADYVCPKLRSAFRRGLGDRSERHSWYYRIDHHRRRFDIRLLGNWVGAIHVTPIRETCGRSTAPRLLKVKNLDAIEGQRRRAPGWPRPGAPRCQSCLRGSTCHRVSSPTCLRGKNQTDRPVCVAASSKAATSPCAVVLSCTTSGPVFRLCPFLRGD
jgi:hypothetical protein